MFAGQVNGHGRGSFCDETICFWTRNGHGLGRLNEPHVCWTRNGHGLGKRDETSYLLTKKMVMVLEE